MMQRKAPFNDGLPCIKTIVDSGRSVVCSKGV